MDSDGSINKEKDIRCKIKLVLLVLVRSVTGYLSLLPTQAFIAPKSQALKTWLFSFCYLRLAIIHKIAGLFYFVIKICALELITPLSVQRRTGQSEASANFSRSFFTCSFLLSIIAF